MPNSSVQNITIKGNPISINRLYRGRRFLTEYGKEVKEDYYHQAKAQWRHKPLAEGLKLTIFAFFGSKRVRDLDNIAKAVQDSLKGLVYEDDSLINELHIHREFDKENPRMEIYIEKS